ncbi:MAG: RelA/SpoT AH/RIS domain-containing protein [Pseudomonadota bacterium]
MLTNETYRDLGRRFRLLEGLDHPSVLTIVNVLKLNVNRCFRNAKLRHQDFSNIDLDRWDFSGADLRGSNFSGASISGAIFFCAKVDFDDLRKASDWSPKVQNSLRSQVEGKSDPRLDIEKTLGGVVEVFTPQRHTILLPTGSTVLDFAYHIHSDIGDECVSAEVNGIARPISAELRDGDLIKIIRSPNAYLPADWPNLVTTRKAQQKIRKRINREARANGIEAGNKIVQNVLSGANLQYTQEAISGGLKRLGARSIEDVLEKVGRGKLATSELVDAIYPGVSPAIDREVIQTRPAPEDLKTVIIGSGHGDTLKIAKCCMPIPGQRLVGIKDDSNHLLVHSIACSQLALEEYKSNRWVDLRWRDDLRGVGVDHEIIVDVVNKAGVLSEVLGLIARYGLPVLSIRVSTEHIECLRLFLMLQVTRLPQVGDALTGLRGLNSVISAESSGR